MPELEKRVAIERLAGKVSKQDVDYRPSEEGTKSSCSECQYYEAPSQPNSSCIRVAGPVEGKDICDLFKSREYENSQGVPSTVVQLFLDDRTKK